MANPVQYGFNNNDPSIKYAPQYAPQPIIQQPTSMQQSSNTIVINNQQGQASDSSKRRWSTGRCECLKDFQSCCLVYWLGDLYGLCWVAKVNENFCLPCCCPESWMGAVRTKIRTKYNIEGSVLEDLCLTSPVCICCCRPFIFCQMIREVDIMTQKGQPII